MSRKATAALIVSTYNNPDSLRKCLWGLQAQSDPDFEVVIADDGSDERTRALLHEEEFDSLRIRHIWQADQGYRVRMARNRAIACTDADLLIFLDGDCIPRADFVAAHRRICVRGSFCSGARIDIPTAVHRGFRREDVLNHRVFDVRFLSRADPSLRRFAWRLKQGVWYEAIANMLTYRHCVFVSSNGSAWRNDVVAVNGFDEAFPGYGSDDRDLGVRLGNHGVVGRYRKFSVVVLHLDHPKPYDDPVQRAVNRAAFKRRFRDGTTRIELGLDSVLDRS